MDALVSMLVEVSRTFLQDVSDLPELSNLNKKLKEALDAAIADSSDCNELNTVLRKYYSEIMMLYSKYPQSIFLDSLMHRIESLVQIANTIDGKL